MPSQWLSRIAVLVHLILSSASSTFLTISKPSLTPWNIEDAWTLTGSLSLTSRYARNYESSINIIVTYPTGDKILCEFSYADCSSWLLPDSPINTCQCTGLTGYVYLFSVRRQGQMDDGQIGIKATLRSLHGPGVNSSTERLPLMYRTTAVYGSHTVVLSGSSRVTVPQGQPVKVSVEVVWYGYQLTVEVTGMPPITATGTSVTITPPLGRSTAKVTLTTGDNTATFTFNITVDSTDRSAGVAPDLTSGSQDLIPSALLLFLVATSVIVLH